jgi:hypothetical protein
VLDPFLLTWDQANEAEYMAHFVVDLLVGFLIVALSFGRLGNGLGSRCFMRERFPGRSSAGAKMGERERAFWPKGRHRAK